MAGMPLTEARWEAIRQHWEFDLDEPSLTVAAGRAAERLDFKPPTRQAVAKRQQRDAAAAKAKAKAAANAHKAKE